MAQFSIGKQIFRTKGDAKAKVRRILSDAQPGTKLNGSDAQLVADLIMHGRHPEAEEKVGVGISHIEVRAATFGSPCFWIVRTDGSEVDFSYKQAFDGPPSMKIEVCTALRQEIRDQIQEFHELQRGHIFCSICGDDLDSADAQVSYAKRPTFDTIALKFANAHGGWPALAVVDDGPYGSKLANRSIAAEWAKQHRTEANLSLAHRQCNQRGR
jgi:hypothetical protein